MSDKQSMEEILANARKANAEEQKEIEGPSGNIYLMKLLSKADIMILMAGNPFYKTASEMKAKMDKGSKDAGQMGEELLASKENTKNMAYFYMEMMAETIVHPPLKFLSETKQIVFAADHTVTLPTPDFNIVFDEVMKIFQDETPTAEEVEEIESFQETPVGAGGGSDELPTEDTGERDIKGWDEDVSSGLSTTGGGDEDSTGEIRTIDRE